MLTSRLAAAFCAGLVLSSLAIPAFAGNKARIKTTYYTISGRSAERLEQQLALRGPMMQDRRRALASAHLKFDPVVRYGKDGKRCRVQSVQVDVDATMTLPKWRERRRIKGELARYWDSFATFARSHEETHVRIAEAHAAEMERAIQAIKPTRNCHSLTRRIDGQIARVMRKHNQAQDRFDRSERKRMARGDHLVRY